MFYLVDGRDVQKFDDLDQCVARGVAPMIEGVAPHGELEGVFGVDDDGNKFSFDTVKTRGFLGHKYEVHAKAVGKDWELLRSAQNSAI